MSRKLNGVFHRIRKLAVAQASRGLSDRDLLQRFVLTADEAAFTAIVERHGPLVLGMCRRVLRNADDADDACQATFLVLARKASSLRRQPGLGGWLHGVAYRIAANLRRQRARRQKREHLASSQTVYESEDDVTWRELRTVLDEELQRLPERYRAPLILCYLGGKTRDEAAQELGTTPGTLHGLLERGRKLLRDRLTQRGLTLSSALFATALTASSVKAALPPSLVVASTKSALAVAAGQAVTIAPQIWSLAQEALKAMFITKLKIGTACVCAMVTATALAWSWTGSASQAQEYPVATALVVAGTQKGESDEDFIRRVSKDLRGTDPSPAEIHFFTANKDTNRRQKIIDLFIQERQAKQQAEVRTYRATLLTRVRSSQGLTARIVAEQDLSKRIHVSSIQTDFYKQLATANKEKKDVATITQSYLERLMQYVKDHPKAEDLPDAMLQISLIYRSQGKTVEADAWRDKLRKDHPKSPAAKTAQDTPVHFHLELSQPMMLLDALEVRLDIPALGPATLKGP